MLPDKAYVPAALGKQLGLRGGKNEPAVLPAVARALADALGADARDVADATTAAAGAFFAFDAADRAVESPLVAPESVSSRSLAPKGLRGSTASRNHPMHRPDLLQS